MRGLLRLLRVEDWGLVQGEQSALAFLSWPSSDRAHGPCYEAPIHLANALPSPALPMYTSFLFIAHSSGLEACWQSPLHRVH